MFRARDQPFPSGDGVDFDRVELAISAGEQIDAGERSRTAAAARRAISTSESSG